MCFWHANLLENVVGGAELGAQLCREGVGNWWADKFSQSKLCVLFKLLKRLGQSVFTIIERYVKSTSTKPPSFEKGNSILIESLN